MKIESWLNRKVQLAFGSAILTLFIAGALSYRGLLLSTESDQWVLHTHQVLESLQNLVLAMQNIESSCRGFALTGQQDQLDSYFSAISREEQNELAVQELTVDNSEQQRHLPALQTLLAQEMQFTEHIIDLRRTAGLPAAAEAMGSAPGERNLDEFQGVVREMQNEERRLLVLRNANGTRRIRQTKSVLIIGTILGLLTAAVAAWSVQRDNSRGTLARETLRFSEENYRLLLDGVQDYAIFRLDPHGKVVSWNAGAQRIKGYKSDEIIGQNFSRFYLQKDIDEHRPEQELQVAASTGRSEVAHWRVRKDGSRFWANVVITAARDSSGTLLGFSEISRDISERKETEARYRGLLEAAPDAMVVVNQGGEIVLLNVQAEKQFGYRRDELLGQKVKNIIPEGFAERLMTDGTKTAGEPPQQIGTGIELAGRRKDGSAFPIEIMLSPLESSEGILVTAAIRDISLRKDAEKHLAQMVRELSVKHQLLDSVVEGTTDFIYIRDLESRFTLANSACAKIFRRTVNAVLGRSLRELLPGDTCDAILRSDQEIVRVGATSTVEEIAEIDGVTRFFLTTKGPYRDADQSIIGTVGISRDITERKISEAHLIKAVAELKRSNEELQQFAYVASHDLQEPLRMVASYTQLLAKRYKGRLDADADEFIAFAVDGANRMQGLIQDLLAYSRAGSNGQTLREVSSDSALKQALANLQTTIQESAAVVTHDSLPAITTEGTQLAQVFQNLIGNAIKYRGPEIPRVHVSASKNGGNEWIFSVRDNGLGIDPQYFDRIFILFQRLHGREEFKGSGIGLAICKKMLERLGGRIWVESEPHKGSTFYFALPESDGK